MRPWTSTIFFQADRCQLQCFNLRGQNGPWRLAMQVLASKTRRKRSMACRGSGGRVKSMEVIGRSLVWGLRTVERFLKTMECFETPWPRFYPTVYVASELRFCPLQHTGGSKRAVTYCSAHSIFLIVCVHHKQLQSLQRQIDLRSVCANAVIKRLQYWRNRCDLLVLLQHFLCTSTACNTNVSYAVTKQIVIIIIMTDLWRFTTTWSRSARP